MDVQLRPVEDADLPLFFAMHRDPVSVAMAGVPGREAHEFDAHWAKIRVDPAVVLRSVLVDGEVAGLVVCFPRDGQQELGYWLRQEHWGRGVASVAVAAFLAEHPSRPLSAGVLGTNAASLRVLAKAGFVEVAREDGSVLFRLD